MIILNDYHTIYTLCDTINFRKNINYKKIYTPDN